ncbi:MAG: CdaR family protein [Bilophila sp.]
MSHVRWLYLLVAFIAALGLWYTLNAREQIERVVDVRLDYKGLPAGLIVTDGQINKISVRLRGPTELLRAMTSRELSYTLDLANVTKGNNVIPMAWNRLPDFRVYEVLEVIPSRILLKVDEIMEVTLPVKVALRSSLLTPSLRLKDVEVRPAQVTLRGPAGELATLKDVTVEIPADLDGEGKVVNEELPVLAPPAVEAVPQMVTVQRRLEVRRRNMSLQRDVMPEAENDNLQIRPERVSLVVSVPQALARDTGYLAQFQVTVPVNEDEPGEKKVPVQVSTPQGGRVVKVTPDSVTLSLRPEQ